MAANEQAKQTLSQADKFKEAARKHQADESEAAWEARLKKIAKAKPVEKKAQTS
jgi:hypothetical protein